MTRLKCGLYRDGQGVLVDGEGGLQDPNWDACEDCGELVHIEHRHYSERDGAMLCRGCYNKERDE